MTTNDVPAGWVQSFVREVEQAGNSQAEEGPHRGDSPRTEADLGAPELPSPSPLRHAAEPESQPVEGLSPHKEGAAPPEPAESQVHRD